MEHLVAKASKPPANNIQRRLNLKALIILGVVLVAALASFFPIKALSDRSTRQSALAQAKASEKAGDIDLALRHMQSYVIAWPDDLPGLEYRAKLLADTARNDAQVLAAAQANDLVLRLDPDGPDRQETRRRIIRLYVLYGDIIRRGAELRKEQGSETSSLRYRAAATVARQLIAKGANDAEAHRLLALALEGIVSGGDTLGLEGGAASVDTKALDEAIAEYRKSIELEPTDTVASERLAFLQSRYKRDPVAAESTMAAMLKAQPKSVAVRMARYRFYGRIKDDAKALVEIEAASDLAPHDARVQADAASDALIRQDYPRARRHLEAITGNEANDLRARTLKGMLELSEKHPDEAIEEWRKGLVAVGGTDSELTWKLAFTLIQLGRLNEARPLVTQFNRLAGVNDDSMSRFLKAMYEQRGGHPNSAIKELTRIAEKVPSGWQPELYLNLGRCHESLGDEGQAMLAYQKAVSLAPSATEPRRAIARILGAKNSNDSLAEMERALSQNPNDLTLLVEVGRLQLRREATLPENQRRWASVDAILDKASKVDPDNFSVQTLKADVFAASGRLDQAVTLLRAAVEGPSKTKVPVWLTYAGALDRLNRREEALQVLERGSAPDAAGDHALMRIARARLLAGLNRGQAARDVLANDRDKVPRSERPELAHALAELSRQLGDRDAARAALADWAKQVPDSAEPGLSLLAFAQSFDDDEAARMGLEALRSLGGDQEPYGLAARALELLRVPRARTESPELIVATDPAELKRVDEADRLVTQLNVEAPQLAVVPLLQGMILERRGKLDEAIEAYRRAIKEGTATPALPRLVELLSRQKRFDEIAQLKVKYENRANTDGIPSLGSNFDQVAAVVALKVGDKERAEQAVAEMVQAQPDNLTARAGLAKLLSGSGKNREAEATLRQLVLRKPADPAPWLALVAFRSQHPELGDINKLIDEVRVGYKGPHPELVVARCRWNINDIPAATKLYDAAVAQNGDDMTTLRDSTEFDTTFGRTKEAEAKLRRALKIDPKATWASRTLAMLVSAKPDRTGWREAWSLIKPGAPGSGQSPEDRLIRATLLARSPENAQRLEAAPAFAALANDLPASNPIAVEARVRLAQALLESNRAAEAVRTIAPVADDLDRPNVLALAISIEALARSNDVAAAGKYLDRLVALEPKSPKTAASKAWVLQKSRKPEEAFAVVQAAYNEAEAAPAPGGEAVALAFQDLLVKLDNKDGAIKLAERIAVKWPKDAYVLARTQLADGKIAEAIKSCQIAIEAGEALESVRVATQIAILKKDDVATIQAVDDLDSAALAQAPKAPDVLIFIATLRHLQGRYDEEVALYRQALENVPSSYLFLNNMAWTLCEGLQRYDEALERIDDVIRRQGRASQFLDTRGVILARLGRFDEAIADLEQSVAWRPVGDAYFHLARTYRQANKPEDYRRCRDLARKAKLDISTLDPTDRADVSSVMDGK